MAGSLEYLTGPDIHTQRMMAHLGRAEDGLEAYVFAPCCDGGPAVLSFPEVRTLEGGGTNIFDFHFTVDAPGYEHAFASTDGTHWYDVQTDGAIDATPLGDVDPSTPLLQAPTDPIRPVWVGAITTEHGDPWASGQPVAMVRRRIIP